MDPRFALFQTKGHTILVGSVDAHGTAAICRGVAVASSDGYRTLTAYLPLSTSQDVIASVAATNRIAVTVTEPPSHCSVQFKGTVTNVRLAREDESPMVRAQLERTAESLDTLGVPKRVFRSV